jgi:PBP1b-binding outer membrane lipoprotein LpoB
MIKKLMAVVFVAMLVGCASVQSKVDSYKEKRANVISTVEFIKAEKDCIVQCNQDFDFGIKRADCKTGCIK